MNTPVETPANTPYKHCYISEHLIRIDSADVSAWLALGTDRAALIDSCAGEGNIGDYARSLTSLPLFCILTHGHVDHIGGAMTVEQRYLHPLDFALAEKHGTYEARLNYVGGKKSTDTASPDVQKEPVTGFLPLEDGQRFDLGGFHLTMLLLPGHTRGSMTVLFEEDRTLLLGDACNPLTFLFFPGMPSIEEYRDNLIEFRDRHRNKFDRVLFSHSEQAGPDILDENIRVCGRILDKTDDRVPFNIPRFASAKEKPVIAMAILGHPKERRRADGKRGNIAYLPSNIYTRS